METGEDSDFTLKGLHKLSHKKQQLDRSPLVLESLPGRQGVAAAHPRVIDTGVRHTGEHAVS